MDTLYKQLIKIKENPEILIGEKSLSAIFHFTFGYIWYYSLFIDDKHKSLMRYFSDRTFYRYIKKQKNMVKYIGET